MGRKLVFWSVGFAAAVYCVQALTDYLWAVCILAILIAAACVIFILKGYWKAAVLLVLGALLGVGWTFGYICWDRAHIPDNITGREYSISVLVTDYSSVTKKGNHVSFQAEIDRVVGVELNRPIRAIVYYPQTRARLKPGDRMNLIAEFTVAEDTESFDSYTYYKIRGIDFLVFSKEEAIITRCDKVSAKYFHKTLAHAIRNKISTLLPDEQAGFLNALLTGNKANISEALKEKMRITGLSHTIAVSGMHVSFLVGLVVLLFGKRYAAFAAIPIMLVFVLVSGSTPSVMRAFIMQSFLLTAPLIMREADSVTSLFAALFIILLINPYAIGDVGMQLSFASALGIILFSSPFKNFLLTIFKLNRHTWHGRFISSIVSVLSATGGALAFTLPLIVYYYDTVSLISPISNIVILWAISFLFSLGVAVVGLSFVWFGAAKLIAPAVSLLIRGIYAAVEILSNVPYAAVYGKSVAALAGIAAGYASVILLYAYIKRKSRTAKYAAPSLAAVCIAMIFISAYTPKTSEVDVTVFDVGQGLSFMAEHKSSRVVVDCGGNRENAGNIVYNKLLEKNARDIDALILTHHHTDHTNGVEMLLSKAKVKQMYIPARLGGIPEMRNIIKTAQDNGTKIYAVDDDMSLHFGDMKVRLIYCGGLNKENDTGIAVVITKDEFNTVITGDLENDGEIYLLDNNDLPHADVYIVGHHGSKLSSSENFLNEIHPEYAIISVGANNMYGHPEDETLKRLNDHGTYTVRTDKSGTVCFNSAALDKLQSLAVN